MAATGQAYYRSIVMLDEGVAWGTAGTTGFVLRCNDVTPRDEQRLIENRIYKGDRKVGQPFRDVRRCGCQVTVPVFLADEIGWWMKHCIGVPATTGSGTYTHTSKVGFSGASEGDLHDGFSLDLGYTDLGTPQYDVAVGNRVQETVIQFSAAGPTQWQITTVCKSWAMSGAAQDGSPTSYTSANISHSDISAMTEGGGASTIILDGEIRITNNLDDGLHTVNNSGLIGDLPTGYAAVTGRVRALFQDLSLYNKAANGTESSLGVTWTSGATSLAITIPELMYERCKPVPGSGSALVLEMPFQAFEGNHADATLLKAILTNTVASYA